MDLTAQVGAVVGTSALLYFMTAPRQQECPDGNPLCLTTPWEEESTLARTRRIRDKFQKKKSGSSNMTYSPFRRKTSSMEDETCGMTSSDGSVTSQQSVRSASSVLR